MPQEPAAYLKPDTAEAHLLPPGVQQKAAQDFLARHFSPWDAHAPLEETQHPFWALKWLENTEVFAHNLLPVTPKKSAEFRQRCAPAEYPSEQRHAISIVHTDVRALPTRAPMFGNLTEAGEGFPFDYLQHGVLPAGTPLLITHASTDHAWVFVETPLLYGWVPAHSVALVDRAFKEEFRASEYVVVLEDGRALQGRSGANLPPTRAGSILPLLERSETGFNIALPRMNAQGYATMESARIDADAAQPFPLPFTPAQVADLSTRFMQQPYAWGDRFSGRDCSGTMRDLFAPFGIWLPRNSGDQAETGRVIALDSIPPAERGAYIARHAQPFATLLHLPGHIMLYLGEYAGKNAVLHAIWGVRYTGLLSGEGRLRIGKTAITSLEPGYELNGLCFRVSSLLERLDQMNIPHAQP
jgi:cell wall-associated NlpC family hydrolase